ncbi:hypothetical protein D3C80_2067720 [compost metagenome]
MANNVLPETDDQRLTKGCKPCQVTAGWSGQTQTKFLVAHAFTGQATHHEAVVALAREAAHFLAEFRR